MSRNWESDGGAAGGEASPETQLVATTRKLHDLLKQREFHLAELIDEVVYAEDRKDEAIQGSMMVKYGVDQLEGTLQQLLHFHVVLSEEVILPALLDAARLRMSPHSAALVLDGKTRHAMHALTASPALSQATRQLMQSVLEADAQALASEPAPAAGPSTAQTEEIPRMPTNNQKIEQAIVLSGMLWRKQRELIAALEQAKHRLERVLTLEEQATEQGHARSYESTSPARRGSSAEALMTINRRRSASSAPALASNGALVDTQEQLAALQRERDTLWQQLQSRGDSDTEVVASLLADKRQLEHELLYAQRRTLEEQNRNSDLKHRVLELESALDSARRAATQGLVSTEEEMHRLSRSTDLTRASLESEVARLRQENQALVESGERLQHSTSFGEVAAKRKVAKLEGVIASLKTDLNIVESRLAVIQDQREAERQRIVHQFEREKQRLQQERDECQRLIDKMACELKLLSRDHEAMRAAASVEQM